MSESSVPRKASRIPQFWLLAGMSVGIIGSLLWAAFLGWLIFRAFSGLI